MKTGFGILVVLNLFRRRKMERTVSLFSLLVKIGTYVIFLFAVTGVSETVVLNMSTLVWSFVTTVQERVPVASEVCPAF